MHAVLIAVLALLFVGPVSEGAAGVRIRIGEITIGAPPPSQDGGSRPETTGIKRAFEKARAVLLEPVSEIEVETRNARGIEDA